LLDSFQRREKNIYTSGIFPEKRDLRSRNMMKESSRRLKEKT
jgi:hypothetical protein